MLTAEGAFEFLFDELERIDSFLSIELLDQMKLEISKRRNKSIVSFMKFFQNPQSLNDDKTSFFAMSTKKEIFAQAVQIYKKYFNHQIDETESEAELECVEQTDENSIETRLGMAIGKKTTPASELTQKNNLNFCGKSK